MPGESLQHSGESFRAKDAAKLAADLLPEDAAEVEYGTTPPDSSPLKQIERGEFEYDEPGSPDYVEEGHSSDMLQAVVDRYFREQPRSARQTQYRYDQLTARDLEPRSDVPRATVVIPIAVHNEDAATMRDTLTEIAAQAGVEQDEIVLYGNMPDTLSEVEKQAAQAKLDEVIAEALQAHPHLKVRSVVVEYPEDKLTIGRVRHDYMDLIAWDGARRGFGVDHPVIMLDADTKQMTKDAFEQLAGVLTDPDSDIIVAHAETHYLFDKDNQAESLGDMPDVRKLAVLQEIRRRQYWRQKNRDRADTGDEHGGEVFDQRRYDEEWGTAVALGACMLVGSYNERGTMSENGDLIQRLNDRDRLIYDVMRHAKPDLVAGRLYNGVYYVPGTSVRSSGRRQEQRLREWVAGGVDDRTYAGLVEKHIESGHQYGDFGHTDALRVAGSSAEPSFKDDAQAQMIVKSVLTPDSVPAIDGDPVPLPDPAPLLRRLDLPQADDETPRSSRN